MEVAAGETGDQSHAVVRGKRTRRHRMQLSGFSCGEGEDRWGQQSPTSSDQVSGSVTEEEEDMANCLMLLAQGSDKGGTMEGEGGERVIGRRFWEAPTGGRAGICVYECKTCNRCFPSFQALGGHRASHKKPKSGDEIQNQSSFPARPIGSGDKPRVHECSICGSEFSSGQALGGHMRRHRPTTADSPKRSRNTLGLDLNLPAPDDDDRDPPAAFPFDRNPPLVLSRSPLIDCHY